MTEAAPPRHRVSDDGEPMPTTALTGVADAARVSGGRHRRAAVQLQRLTEPAAVRVGSDQAPVVAPLTVLVICALLVLMQLYLAIPLAPVVAETLGDDVGAASWALLTAYSLAYGFGLPIFGPLSDRYGRKVVMVPGMIALAIATAALVAVSTLPVIAVVRTVQGLVAASFAAAALAYVGEALPPRWRSTGLGAISTTFLVAGIVGQLYGQAVSLALGWRWAFGLAAPAFAIAAVALAMVLVEPRRGGKSVSLGQKYRQFAALAVHRQLGLVFVAACTVLLSFVAMYTRLGPLLQAEFGLGNSDVQLVRLAALPAMMVAPVAGWLFGRFGGTRVTVAGFMLASVGLVAEAVAVDTLWALVSASVIFVAGIATVIPAVIALASSRAGSSRAGAVGLMGFGAFLGASCAPLVAQLPLGFGGLMLVLVALLMIGAVLVVLSGRGRPVQTA